MPRIWLIEALPADSPALQPRRWGLDFIGKPLPRCDAFWITEAGALYRFDKAKTHLEWILSPRATRNAP